MFKNFNKEDLEVLWSIVKERFKKTKPVDDMDNLLFQTLKTMFEHHAEDNIWRYQQGLHDDIRVTTAQIPGQEFDEPPSKEETLSFIQELGHSGEINGKVSGLDKLQLSRAQILWGMYQKKNLDFVALIWEDMAYQIDNKDSKKQDKMFYPRFTVYLTISFEETPSKKKPTKAKKDVPSTKKPATKPKPTKKKAPVKADRGKSLNGLLEVALSKVAQLKEVTKQSKKDFHISHASGSSDGTNFQLGVLDKRQRKISGID
nr:hypothetical protein [Tanacetum cinerariifolium]